MVHFRIMKVHKNLPEDIPNIAFTNNFLYDGHPDGLL